MKTVKVFAPYFDNINTGFDYYFSEDILVQRPWYEAALKVDRLW